MRKLVLISTCLIFLLSFACQKSGTSTNREATNAPTNQAVMTASPSPTRATTTISSANTIGVPECDQFLEAYETCVASKVPDSARAQYKTALAQWRTSWHTLASNPQTKGSLTQACKTAMVNARTSMKTYGCSF